MKKITPIWILTGIIIILSAGIIGILIFLKNQPPEIRGIAPLVEIKPSEPDSEKWGINYPNEYTTFLKTGKNDTSTVFGGSKPISKLEADPRLVTLFAGYSFSKDYNEERGHVNALQDVRNTKRLNETTPATCYSCKSSDNPSLWNEMGMEAYDKMKFTEMSPQITHSIGCANCHEAGTMRLIVTNPALDTALKTQGKTWQEMSRQEMRSLVCANCHVEYYMKGEGKTLVLPWEKGTKIEQISDYYKEIKFTDWKHKESEADVVKMQHPEYEVFTQNSTHFKAGVTCADCHMPYVRDGSAKYSSHDVKSPLLTANQSCAACHTNVDYVVERANLIQQQVWSTISTTEDALVQAIAAISAASKTKNPDTTLLEEARTLQRDAQIRWDFIAAENSMGFHNPEEALRILAAATDLARQANLKAVESTLKQ